MAPHDRLRGMVNARSDSSTFRASRAPEHGRIGCSRNYRPPHPSAPVSQGEMEHGRPNCRVNCQAYNSRREITPNRCSFQSPTSASTSRFPDESKSVAHQYDNELLIRQTHRYSTIPSNWRVASVVAKGGSARLSCHLFEAVLQAFTPAVDGGPDAARPRGVDEQKSRFL